MFMLTGLSGFDIVIVLVAIIISMTIHEAMHGFVAHALGDTTARDEGRLTLNPLKHIDILTTVLLPIVLIIAGRFPIFAAKPVPINSGRLKYGDYGMAIVGLAGPLTNLLLAVIGAVVLNVWAVDQSLSVIKAIEIFIMVNIGFFVFNMIPFPPLDGSRLLYAFAPEPMQEFMMRIEAMGFLTVLVFIYILFTIGGGLIMNVELSIYNFIIRI